MDGTDEIGDVAEGAAAQAILRQVAEEPLHHVLPGETGWGEVESQPALEFGVFASGCPTSRRPASILSSGSPRSWSWSLGSS